MSTIESNPNRDLVAKIARLVQEKGWNQEDFARHARLNRQTARQILQPSGDRNLRNSTVQQIAFAFGLSVIDLRTLPLDRLLARITHRVAENGEEGDNRLLDLATQPELRSWIERNPQRSRELRPDEIEELLSLQDGRALTTFGVENFVTQIENRRDFLDKARCIFHTEYGKMLGDLVDLIYEKIQPPGA